MSLKLLVKSTECSLNYYLKHKTVNKVACRAPSTTPSNLYISWRGF